MQVIKKQDTLRVSCFLSVGYKKRFFRSVAYDFELLSFKKNHPRNGYLYFFAITYYLFDKFRKRRVKSEELIVKK